MSSSETQVGNGRGLLLAEMDFDPAREAEINRWYDEEHFPERLEVPGFLCGRRFKAIEGTPKYLAIYELESPEVLETEAYQRIRGASERQKAVVSGHVFNVRRNVYVDVTPKIPSGYRVSAVRA